MQPKFLSDDTLFNQLQAAVEEERQATLCVLIYLREIERRMLYAKRGFSSLHLFCVKICRYSEAAASRRISAMRLLRDLPGLAVPIESGELSLCVLSMAQSCLRREGITPSLEFFEGLQRKSVKEVQRELATRFPNAPPPEKVSAVSATETEIRFTANQECYQNLTDLRAQLAASSFGETIAHAVKLALQKPNPRTHVPTSEARGRYIPVHVERAVRERDEHQCAYQDPKTGRKCGEKFGFELDHVIPVARGGKSTVENLRLVCRAHNRLAAVETFGAAHMSQFYQSTR